MATASVVECFNVGEHTRPHFVAGGIGAQIDQFAFQRTKEASHGRIVVPGAYAVHADLEAAVLEQRLIGAVGVLTALVGMVNQAREWLALLECHLRGRECQLAVDPFRHGPADNATRIQVEDRGQIGYCHF